MHNVNRRTLMKHTVNVGVSMIASKALGLIRLILEARYLGTGVVADAFVTAFRIPNSLRKIFAEGSLTAAFVPTLITVLKQHGKEDAERFVTLTFMVIQGFLCVLCAMIAWWSLPVMQFVAPGWFVQNDALDKIVLTSQLLKILIFFILFISTSSLLAGVLNAYHHFSVPAWSQVLVNIVWIGQLFVCWHFSLPVYVLALSMLINGLILVLIHVIACRWYNFFLKWPQATSWHYLYQVLAKFLPCLVSMGALEINLFIDQILASYLPEGSLSLLYYTTGFMRLPLAVFATSLATILLPHYSRVQAYAPKRLNYYLLESCKLVIWVMLPISLLMIFFARQALLTTLLSDNFPLERILQAEQMLKVFAIGLFFFSLNRVLLNVYYAMHETVIPTTITVITTVLNTLLNLLLMQYFLILGIVIATCIAEAVKTLLLLYIAQKKYGFHAYKSKFLNFFGKYLLQVSLVSVLFYIIFKVCSVYINLLPPFYSTLLLTTLLYWLWVSPLILGCAFFLYSTRSFFGIKLYFIS